MTDGLHARIRYTEPMLRRAVRVYVWRSLRRLGWLWMLAIGLVVVSLVVAVWLGDKFWAGFGAALLLFVAIFVFVIWRAHFLHTVGRFRALDPPEADITVGPDSLTARSNLGGATIPWAQFVQVWELPGFLMLFLAPNNFMTIPTGDLAPEVLAALRSHLPAPS